MCSKLIHIALAAAAVCAAAKTADAKPRRVVVLEFDGRPADLADTGRASVMGLLGDQYDVVATKRWEAAFAQFRGDKKMQWKKAAKQAGVDAVIEGYITEEGRHHMLTVGVRDAVTGQEIDSVSVRVTRDGVPAETSRKLAVELDEVFEWIDTDGTQEDLKQNLPDLRKPSRDDEDEARPERRPRRDYEELSSGDDDLEDRPVRKYRPRRSRHRLDIEDERDRDRDRDREPGPANEALATAPAPAAAPAAAGTSAQAAPQTVTVAPQVATADQDTQALYDWIGPKEVVKIDTKVEHVPIVSRRFSISAGAYIKSRGMSFDYDPDAQDGPPEYPGQNVKGLSLAAAVYPFPRGKVDQDRTGLGFTFEVAKSVGSIVAAQDDSGYGDYAMDNTAWNLGVHYRFPFDMLTFDFDGSYGRDGHKIIDLPESIEIPDTDVSYFGVGANMELAVTEHSKIGFGGRYMYVLGTGDISDQDWYGAGTAWGLQLDTYFTLPLPHDMFVRTAIEYRRVDVEFEGSGVLSDQWGVWNAIDSSIGGSAQVGVQF